MASLLRNNLLRQTLSRCRYQSWLATKKSPPSLASSALVLAETKDDASLERVDPFSWMLRDENLSAVCQYIDQERKFANSKDIYIKAREYFANRHLEAPFHNGRMKYIEFMSHMHWELGDYYYYFREEGYLFERVKIMNRVTGCYVDTRFPLFHIDDLAHFLDLADTGELVMERRLVFSPCAMFALVAGRFAHGLSNVVAVLSLAEGLRPAERIVTVVTGVTDAVWCGSAHLVCSVPDRLGKPTGEVRCLDLWQVPAGRNTYRPLLDAATQGRLLYSEPDPRFAVHLSTTHSHRFVAVRCQSQRSSEVHLIECPSSGSSSSSSSSKAPPEDQLQCRRVWPRQAGLEYRIDHYRDSFYALANTAVDGELKVLRCNERDDVHAAGRDDAAAWATFVDESAADCFVKEMSFHGDDCVLTMRDADARPYLHLVPLAHEMPGCLDHPYEQRVYPDFACTSLLLACNPSPESVRFGFVQSGPAMPSALSYFHPTSGLRESRSASRLFTMRAEDRTTKAAVVRRVSAVCPHDGARIPVTLVYQDGCLFHRMLVNVYGDLNAPTDMHYCSQWFQLVAQGWVLAFCHVRGSRDLGRRWFLDGAGPERKEASFRDLQTCVEYLHQAGFSRPEHTALYGFSAGGTLVAGLAQREPELFRAAVLHAPFVDVLRAHEEEGAVPDPRLQDCGDAALDAEALERIADYCPYSQLTEQSYPDMLISAGRRSTVVPVVGVARYVARLRAVQEPWVFESGRHQHSALWLNVSESDDHRPPRVGIDHQLVDKHPAAVEMIFLDRAV